MGKLQLSSNKIIAGVCGGYAEFFGMDANIMRIIFVVITIFGGCGLLLYLVSWLVMALNK